MDACIGHDRAGRNRIRILLHDPLDQHAGCHRIYRPGAARPAVGSLKDENADQPPSATNWIFGTTREVFDEVFDGFSRIVIQVITSSYAFPCINQCKLHSCLTALQTLNPISPTISLLPPAIAVVPPLPSALASCWEAHGLQ